MRTTVVLDPDVEAAVAELQREHNLGRSEALNLLARRGAARRRVRQEYVHRSAHLGPRVDVTNVGDVLDLLDDRDATA